MQLGSRWQAGGAPHRGVPALLHDAIRLAEAEYPHAHSWTLTWLEGRPRVELFDAQATLLRDIGVSAQGEVKVASRPVTVVAGAPAETSADGVAGVPDAVNSGDDDYLGDDDFGDDDDDWLN